LSGAKKVLQGHRFNRREAKDKKREAQSCFDGPATQEQEPNFLAEKQIYSLFSHHSGPFFEQIENGKNIRGLRHTRHAQRAAYCILLPVTFENTLSLL